MDASGAMALAEGLLAVVLAGVLFWLRRMHEPAYLSRWSAAWVAFAALVAADASWQWISANGSADSAAAVGVLLVMLVAGQLVACLLLLGAVELRDRFVLSRRRQAVAILAFIAIGLASGVAYAMLPSASSSRVVLRIGVPALSTAMALALAAWNVARSSRWPGGPGRRLVAVGLAMWSVTELARLTVVSAPLLGAMGYARFLLEAIVGIGMVAGILEAERQRLMAIGAELQRLSHHDNPTDLPNRRLLTEFLAVAISRAPRTDDTPAVAHLDLDQFHLVNSAWSQALGDAVLRAVGDRLRAMMREGDMLAHLTGDSFALVLLGRRPQEEKLAFLELLARRIRQPFVLHEREVHLTASIGVAFHPEHGADAETLLRAAEAAMYQAKEAGRNRTVRYEATMRTRAGERLAMERALHHAISGDEFRLHYQPIVEIDTGRIVKFEALLRWQHPERGLLGPDQFLPVIEGIGLSDALDQWVLRTACTEATRWRAAWSTQAPRVSVNLSARPLQHPDLPRRIETVLADTGFPASALELEITESAAMEDAEETLMLLRELKRSGLHLAIDDFGTGFSSLSYLRTFPIDTIKIDRAFVRDLGVQQNAVALIAGIVALGHSLGLSVVAEGVETEEQREILREQRCPLLQGFLVGRPMPAAACAELGTKPRLVAREDRPAAAIS